MGAQMSDAVVVDNTVSAPGQRDQPLYADRVKVYPKRVSGTFRKLKWWLVGILLTIYYLTPWIRWDRGPGAPDQAVLIDMPNRRAYFFFIEIWPQEIYYLMGLMLLGAVGLFLVTSLAGRVWCGYGCPQTVWTDLFMLVERWIEGDRNARIKLDKQPLSPAKAGKKVAKHAAWLVIAALTGGAWIMYFNDAPTVVADIFTGSASTMVYFFVALFTATTYLLAGWAREQVCTYMCPWPRFQAAMFDEDTLIVTYQPWRGEPRGKATRRDPRAKRGDCVDCNLCVAVCPMGIDIRDGLQMECIGCALCIDACDSVMDKLELPRGLITYDTERNQVNRAAGKPLSYRLVRPRTVLYTLLALVIGGAMLWSLAFRATLDINVLHDRNPLFVTLSDGSIRNGYTVKILNMTRAPRDFVLDVEGLADSVMSVVGREAAGDGTIVLPAAPDGVATYQVFLRAPREVVSEEAMPITFELTEADGGEAVRRETVFRGPRR